MELIAYNELSDAEHHHWWFVGRRNILSSMIEGLRLPPNAMVLEVGAGTGGNLAMLARFGQVSAFEENPVALSKARAIVDSAITLVAGSCPDEIPFHDRTFDLICMFDVLEHIDDDVSSLHRLKSMLTPTGRLLITVPAYRWLWSSHDVFLNHKRRYTRASLGSICRQAGLLVAHATYFNAFLFLPIVVLRVLCRLLSCAASVSGMHTGILNKLLCLVFSSEATLLRWVNLPFGVSLACVAVRPEGHCGDVL